MEGGGGSYDIFLNLKICSFSLFGIFHKLFFLYNFAYLGVET